MFLIQSAAEKNGICLQNDTLKCVSTLFVVTLSQTFGHELEHPILSVPRYVTHRVLIDLCLKHTSCLNSFDR